MEGENYPPIHANCRCVTVIAEDNPSTRLARDPLTGENYTVDGDMTFNEWRDSLSEEQTAAMKFVDKSAGSGIIRLGINLFDKSDSIYYDTFSIEEEKGFEDIFIHGSPQYVQINKNGTLKNYNASEFAKFLKQNKDYKGGNIRLAACSVGKGENSFAQQLSKELLVRVKAPDDDVYYIPDEGIMYVGSPYGNVGKWRIFDKGDEIK